MKNFYEQSVKDSLPRLMGLLDRNPISKTFGCFDRIFWHYRRTDFASSALQQGVLIAAYSGYSAELIQGIINYTIDLQHSDGSLDEWYPQERGWAGPTGYVLYSVAMSAEKLGGEVEPALTARLKEFSAAAIEHLLNFEETDVLSNHQVMALLAIESALKVFSLSCDAEKKRKLEERVYASFYNKQWSLEYDGCDPGYQSATLSFMARLHHLTGDAKIEEYAKSQLTFLRQFVFPDGSFGGPMGSRGTTNLFVYGFEYWARLFPEHSESLQLLRKGLRAGNFTGPAELDDHYFIYRLAEYAETAALENLVPEKHVEWHAEKKNTYDQQSGMLKLSGENYYGVINLKKGGAGRIFNLQNNAECFSDAGYFLQDTGGMRYATSFIQEQVEIDMSVPDRVKVKTAAVIYRRPVFSVLTFWLFRLFLFFVQNSRIALWTKTAIRRSLMINFKTTSRIILEREIILAETLSITDEIRINGVKIEKCIRGSEFPARSVPQSLYASAQTCTRRQYDAFTPQELQQINSTGSVRKRVL